MEHKVLIVDDELSMREFLSVLAKRMNLEFETAENGDTAVEILEQTGAPYSLVITDLSMPGSTNGLEVLKRTKALWPATQVIMITAFATAETAVQAIQAGAYDYITKPFKVDQAKIVIERALEKYALVAENLHLRQELEAKGSQPDIIGESEAMKSIFELVDRVARTKTTILITGESGTGKELIAREIHRRSGVADGPFIPLNCGAIPENLIEAELFGYKKGAFTGAAEDRDGVFEAANGGTVFLDEIGELPQVAQVKLLRVLQEKKIKPVGSPEERSVDTRVVAATNRDLLAEVEAGRFREDLYYRLNIIPIEVPPLRARSGDVRLLLEHYVAKYSEQTGNPIEGIDKEALNLLLSYDYPGNVRELQNIVERAVTLEMGSFVSMRSLPPQLRPDSDSERISLQLTADGVDLEALVEKLERQLIGQALELAEGSKTNAAKLLGLSFRSLRYRIQKYEMDND